MSERERDDDETQTLAEAGAVDGSVSCRNSRKQTLLLKEIVLALREQTDLMREQTRLLREAHRPDNPEREE